MKSHQPSSQPRRDVVAKVFPYLLPFLLFFAVTGISRSFAVGAAAVCLLLAAGRGPMALLRQRVSPLALAVVLYAAVTLCSGLWSPFGAYAGRESAKTLVALAVFGLVLTRVKQENLRGLLASLDGVLAAVALLCIDASSLGLLSRGFSWLLGLTGSRYAASTIGYEVGVRITGIYSNANVSAGVLAFGLLLSLYLFQTARSEKGRLLTALALGIQALAFFLSFSMGAMGAFAVTCLVYILCAGRGQRLGLFVLMLESVAVTVVCAFAAYPLLGTSGMVSAIPVGLSLVCGGGIWALDRFGGRRLPAALASRGKAAAMVGGGLAVLAGLYVVLAFQLTGGITLSGDAALSRAIYPAAGDYTVTAQGTDADVLIYSQNEAELMMHTQTPLYQGPLKEAAFAVPEDARVVWFQLRGSGRLDAVTLSDGTDLPLGYKLLPGFAANRLQGLGANQNFIQRLVFFRDGVTLWRQRPITGWGLGGVEGQVTAVQPFFYESKYIHNHFIQILVEAGAVGLAAFVGLLGCALWLLLRRRRDFAQEPLLPLLAACLAMMTAHSLTEVVWSTQVYQVVVFLMFASLLITCHVPRTQRHAVAAGRLLALGLGGVTLVFALFQAGSVYAAGQFDRLMSGETGKNPLATLETLDRLEVYDDTTYKANLMVNALQSGGTVGRGTAARCARELLESGEFDACYNAAAYHALPLGQVSAFFHGCHTGLLQERSNPEAWNSIFNLYRQALGQFTAQEAADFCAGVAETGAFLDETNEGLMQPVVLSVENQAFLDAARTLEQQAATPAVMYDTLLALSDI